MQAEASKQAGPEGWEFPGLTHRPRVELASGTVRFSYPRLGEEGHGESGLCVD